MDKLLSTDRPGPILYGKVLVVGDPSVQNRGTWLMSIKRAQVYQTLVQIKCVLTYEVCCMDPFEFLRMYPERCLGALCRTRYPY